MTPAEIAAAPWWRWARGLHSRHGLVVGIEPDGVPLVRVLEDGVVSEIRWEFEGQAPEIRREFSMWLLLPDLADPLLPGWLLHLLRERTGPGTHAHPDVVAGGGWDVWADRAEPGSPAVWRCIGSGDTELDALLAALRGVVS